MARILRQDGMGKSAPGCGFAVLLVQYFMFWTGQNGEIRTWLRIRGPVGAVLQDFGRDRIGKSAHGCGFAVLLARYFRFSDEAEWGNPHLVADLRGTLNLFNSQSPQIQVI